MSSNSGSQQDSYPSSISFIQHNVRKQSAVHHTVLQQAFENGTTVLLIQEPYLNKITSIEDQPKTSYAAITHPSFYTLLPQQGPMSQISTRPRVMAYIRKNTVDFSPVLSMEDPDAQLIEVYGLETFLILNVYNERRGPDRLYTDQRVLTQMDLHKPAIIAGDFNRHNPWWNPAANPDRITELKELVRWLESQDAILLNNEKKSIHGTFFRKNLKYKSVINLTFYTLNFRKYV